ncbi:MAG: hypothetical protein RRZ64_03460 [Rikenellaceae bacterium]
MRAIIIFIFLFLSVNAFSLDKRDSVVVRQKYVEANFHDTISTSADKIVVRRDSLRKNFDLYFPNYDIVSYNNIDYISTKHLELYLKKSYKDLKHASQKVWLSGAGFPFYKPTTSFGIGGAVILSFNHDNRDTLNFKSYVPISLLASIKGQFSLTSGLYLFMKENARKARISFDMSYGMANYFGSGATIKAPSINDKSTQYTQLIAQPKVDMLWRVAKDLYVGPTFNLKYEQLSDIPIDVYGALPLVVQQEKQILNVSLGAMVEYSSIDNPTFPYHGIMANASVMAGYEAMSMKRYTANISIDYRQYHTIIPRGVLAWQVKGTTILNSDNDFFLINPSISIRGVLDRYYIASTVGSVSVEYRQFIGSEQAHSRGEWWTRIGVTLWANGGMWSNEIFKNADFVASFGCGLRYEVQPNKNVCIDAGRATGDKSKAMFYVGFLEYF